MAAPWWQGATLYQVYPRSFCDTNGDGVGDLPGITRHLDYIASLGVDGLWISPFYPSPMRDFGYDVRDHCGVDPLFGTLADFDELLAQAHARGLRVLIDQVWSHTALEHPWFEESRRSRHGPRADWYVWADAKPNGAPPTNWQSWMGGASWTWDAGRQQYYLHNFLTSMPDLNLHNEAVQDALLEVGRFWLARGVDGFRFDTVNYYCHDPLLRDNPARQLDGPADCPAAMQHHVHDVCQPQTLPFLARIRRLLDSHGDRLSVAEIGSENNLERMQEYTRGTRGLHTAYSFVLLGGAMSAQAVAELMRPWRGLPGETGWPSWALSNHDAQRVATRWAGNDPARALVLGWLLLALRGNVFLYQGEELGLPQAELPFECLRDPVGLAHWPRNKGRDGCRTPMPWANRLPHGGFSVTPPWLPVPADHLPLAVDSQLRNPNSHLNRLKPALAFRQRHAALRTGSFEPVHADADVLVVRRRAGADTALLAFNLGPTLQLIALPGEPPRTHDALTLHGAAFDGRTLHLPPHSAFWAAGGFQPGSQPAFQAT